MNLTLTHRLTNIVKRVKLYVDASSDIYCQRKTPSRFSSYEAALSTVIRIGLRTFESNNRVGNQAKQAKLSLTHSVYQRADIDIGTPLEHPERILLVS